MKQIISFLLAIVLSVLPFAPQLAKAADINSTAQVLPIPEPSSFGLVYQSSSENFDFYTTDASKSAIAEISETLENAYALLTNYFGITLNYKPKIWIYPDMTTYHKCFPYTLSNSGHFNGRDIHIQKEALHFNEGLVHELAHALAQVVNGASALNQNGYRWLVEGLARYSEPLGYNDSYFTADFKRNVVWCGFLTESIPSLDALEISDYDEFVALEGRNYGALIVEFIESKYSFAKVFELYKNPGEYEKVFGFSRAEFEKQWKKYMEDMYKPPQYMFDWKNIKPIGAEQTLISNGREYRWYFVKIPDFSVAGLTGNVISGGNFGSKTGDIFIVKIDGVPYLYVDLGLTTYQGREGYRSCYRIRLY